MRPLTLGLVLLAAASAGQASVAATPQAPPGYTLVWSDEFTTDGPPNPSNWTYERGFVRNQELQWYQPANARVSNGRLVIEARRERLPNPGHQAGSTDWRRNREHAAYTSASLTTQGLHSWRYGRLEMRARIDTRPGLWPVFWTLGVSGDWPRGGEVDIMESYQGLLLANVAWGGEQGRTAWDRSTTPLASFGKGWSNRFHVWRMDWDADTVRLFVDDRLLNETDLPTTVNPDGSNPLRRPHYILLNLAIGGTEGGDPTATEFPARFEVDYVRVYQRVEGGAAAVGKP
jgi:beta-glucanase (GH16 family)